MKTSTLQVHDMLSVLSVDDVEKRIGDVPGVESVTVDFAAGRATVRYDETRLSNADIKSAVRQRGFNSTETPAETTPDDTHAQPAPAVSPTPAVSPAPPASVVPDATSGGVNAPAASATDASSEASAPKPDAPAAPSQQESASAPTAEAK